MPELPEVETTLLGIKPYVLQQSIAKVIIRQTKLRWPILKNLPQILEGEIVLQLERRAKYLFLHFQSGTLIVHLGMSGRLQITQNTKANKHDHVDIVFASGNCLRFTDPRRFGAILWSEEDVHQHVLIKDIGPEPLTAAFNASYLEARAKNKNVAVKAFIMDSKVVAGVGNIYATEALFMAQIHPLRAAKKVTRKEYQTLVQAIKKILRAAIKQGGTTLKDFAKPSGQPGYFSMKLQAYGNSGLPCPRCQMILQSMVIGTRNTVYCQKCQT